MKQKRNYSLTAKERKIKRAEAEAKLQGKPALQTENADGTAEIVTQEQAMAAAQKKSKRSMIMVCTIVAVAVVLILTAILVPVIIYLVNPYYGVGKVIARFTLSNDMVLEYEIDESEYDTAATNFIFLAKNKFFDNTVFYDAQNGWLRFGGYEAQPTSNSTSDFNRSHHRKDSADYCKSFKALADSKFQRVTYKFGYRLRSDSGGTDKSKTEQEGALTFRYSDTSTEFQFNYGVDNSGTISGELDAILCTMVGRAYNKKTIENIKQIATTAQLNSNISSGYKWMPPTPDIKIVTVKLYNLNGKKWDDFDFIKYVNANDKNGSRRLSSWTGTV